MYCKSCGNQLPDNAVCCSACGTNQTVYQTEIESADSLPTPKPDKSNVGLNILSWFLPLLGIICYFATKKDRPKEAKEMLKSAIIGICVKVVVVIAFTVLFSIMLRNMNIVGGIYSILDDTVHYLQSVDPETGRPYDTEPEHSKGDIDWTDYTVSINGTNVSIPITYEKFSKATGFAAENAEDEQIILNTGESVFVTMTDKDDNDFRIEVLNSSNTARQLTECAVTLIDVSNNYFFGNADIVFAGGLKVGDSITEKELKKLFGVPDDTFHSDDGADFKYTYYENTDAYFVYRNFTITVYDGVINSLMLEKSY